MHWNPGLCSLSHYPVVPPSLSTTACQCGTAWFTSRHLAFWVLQPLPRHTSSPPLLPISAPPTGLDECFFFNSLVVGLLFSHSSGYYLFLNLLLSFFWLCKKSQCIYLHLHLALKYPHPHLFLSVSNIPFSGWTSLFAHKCGTTCSASCHWSSPPAAVLP